MFGATTRSINSQNAPMSAKPLTRRQVQMEILRNKYLHKPVMTPQYKVEVYNSQVPNTMEMTPTIDDLNQNLTVQMIPVEDMEGTHQTRQTDKTDNTTNQL